MGLERYRNRRNFDRTPEPRPAPRSRRQRAASRLPTFVVQEHHARRLHWDLRLEHDGVLKSWAVTSRPDTDVLIKHLAVETEDHPLEYGNFEGEIPKGEYGAGTVRIFDRGTYQVAHPMDEMLERGIIEVTLSGRKLRGRYILVRTSGEGTRASWLFFKARPAVRRLKIPEVA